MKSKSTAGVRELEGTIGVMAVEVPIIKTVVKQRRSWFVDSRGTSWHYDSGGEETTWSS